MLSITTIRLETKGPGLVIPLRERRDTRSMSPGLGLCFLTVERINGG